MRKLFTTSLLALAVAALFAAASAHAQDVQAIITSDDEAFLIETIEKPGDEPQDILVKNVACKRLAVIGTEKAIPALAAMLPYEKLSFSARYALESMPYEACDAALAQAANELTGLQLVGVVDTIGVRGKAESVPQLKELGAKYADDVLVTKAIYAAMGMIGSEDAAAYLADEANKDFSDADFLLKRGLGDGILYAADKFVKAGNAAGAAELYALLAKPDFPSFVQAAGLYRWIVTVGPEDAAAKIVATLKTSDALKVSAAIKSIRELNDDSGVAAVNALVAAFGDFSEATQVRVARAIGDRKDDGSRQAASALLLKIANDGSNALKVAAAQALAKNGVNQVAAFETLAGNTANFDDAELSDAIVAMAAEFEADDFDAAWKEICADDFGATLAKSDNLALAYMKIAELRRTAEAGKTLVTVAETKEGALRDGALSALSEIVSLDSLDLLVQRSTAKRTAPKSTGARAALTRLPREDCAAKVASLFNDADLETSSRSCPCSNKLAAGPRSWLLQTPAAATRSTKRPKSSANGTRPKAEARRNLPDDRQADERSEISRQRYPQLYSRRASIRTALATKIAMCKTAFETSATSKTKR